MKITITRAEGGSETSIRCSFATVDSLLNFWGRDAPLRGRGYHKCDVVVEFSEEDSYSFRYDLTNGGGEDYGYPDFRKNLRRRMEFMAGLYCPAHLTEEKYRDLLAWDPELSEQVKEMLERVKPILENHP